MGGKQCKPVVSVAEARKFLRPDQLLAIRSEFCQLSNSKSPRQGQIQKEVMIKWLENKFSVQLNPMILERLFQLIDLDANGFIEYPEFIIASCALIYGDEQHKMQQIFNLFDLDGNGKLTKKNYEKISAAMLRIDDAKSSHGEKVPYLQPLLQLNVAMMFAYVSTDARGIDFREWYRYANVSTVIRKFLPKDPLPLLKSHK
mmetsp:Transcript_9094/g.13635  ORF Transcript_9094/g.13635 Transcript_9094/m.13635 type:complete len:201 (+) Transcript_9094:73-675(+)